METKIKELISKWKKEVCRLNIFFHDPKNYNNQYTKARYRAIEDCVEELKKIVEDYEKHLKDMRKDECIYCDHWEDIPYPSDGAGICKKKDGKWVYNSGSTCEHYIESRVGVKNIVLSG